MGPAPKHPGQRRRQNPTVPMVQLPAEGRQGDLPPWPASVPKPTKLEAQVWSEIWSTPQAVMWERMGWFTTVASYVQTTVAANKRGAVVALKAEARQMEDRLGLNPMSMLRLRWEIVEDELAEQRKAIELKAVDGF